MTDPQTYWKKIKVPPALLEAGWVLVKRDSSAPFVLVNEKLDQTTGGFPDPQEAIEAGLALVVELAEAAAIADEGRGELLERPVVLPVKLVDEGWRLHKTGRDTGRLAWFAQRGKGRQLLQTDVWPDPADAVAAAVRLEQVRQAAIEAAERGEVLQVAELPAPAELRVPVEFIEDEANGNGHQETAPAEVLLELGRIRLDGGTQQRALFDQLVLEDYLELMGEGVQFPPVDVFFDGAEYWLADGFYRVEARRKLGQPAIEAQVRRGSQRDAILFSLGANARHGLPRTPDDKRRAVLVMLRDPEWSSWSDAFIAERVRVSVPLVRKLRRQETTTRETESAGEVVAAQPTKRRGRDGRVQDTKRIGKGKTKDEDPQLPLEDPVVEEALELVAPGAKENENLEEGLEDDDDEIPVWCRQCQKEIGSGEFRNRAGLCWECAGMDKKRPRSKPPAGDEEKAPATFAELPQGRDLKVSFYVLKHHPGAVVVSALVGKESTECEFEVAEVLLPVRVLELVELAIEREAVRLARRKPTKKATVKKAPVKKAATRVPARKPVHKASKQKAPVKASSKKGLPVSPPQVRAQKRQRSKKAAPVKRRPPVKKR